MKLRGSFLPILGAGALAGWAAGVSLLFAGELLLFPDLPAPPGGYLFSALLASGLRLLLPGLVLGLLLALADLIMTGLQRREVQPRPPARLLTGLLLAAVLVPPAGVLVAGQMLSPLAGLVIALAGLILSLLLAGILTRRSVWRPVVVVGLVVLIAPLWLTLIAPLCGGGPRTGERLASADGRRVVVLGLDAATWNIIDQRLQPEEMPNLHALAESGVRTTLRSLEPILSNIVWTSAATGVLPERHGIDGFQFDRRFVRVPTVWDLVDEAGGRVGLFKYLVTEPPLPVNGFILPGWMTQNPNNTHPPQLVRRLRVLTGLHHPVAAARFLLQERQRDYRYGLRDRMMAWHYATAFIDLHKRFDPDVAACIWFGTDVLGHKTWQYMAPEDFAEQPPQGGERFRNTLLDCYRDADVQLGRVIRALDDGRTLFILMSDHGMGPLERVERRAHIRGEPLLEILGLDDRFYIPSPHTDLLLNARLPGRTEEATVALAEQEHAVAIAAEQLRSVVRVDDGRPLFEVGVDLEQEPDLRVRVSDPGEITGGTQIRVGQRTLPAWRMVQLIELSGSHRLEGILVMAGPGVEVGAHVPEASIMDVAPTILRVLGLPVAADLDGQVVEWAFTPEWLTEHPQVAVDAYAPRSGADSPELEAPNEKLLEQLRSLGYIQ